jgi:putative transcriptional regulator
MGLVSVRLMADGRLVRERDGVVETLVPRLDLARVERTSEAEIAAQEADDDAEARAAAAAYARRMCRRTGLTQAAFAARIGVPLDTVRNWVQGKRAPAGPARALLRVLDRAPEAALAALE